MANTMTISYGASGAPGGGKVVDTEGGQPESANRAVLKRLRLQRYRGLEDFAWNPNPGVNVILGGGDVGKTTILDALALLLSPSSSAQVTEGDYWRRDTNSGFSIEGVFWCPDGSDVLDALRKTAWPWTWDGAAAVLPDLEGEPADPGADDSVLVFRVSANEDYEVSWEIVNPNGTVDHLPVAVRRKIGLVWLEGDDRNDKDLRLVYGSALDRLIGDPALKSRLAEALSTTDIRSKLLPEAESSLTELDKTFANQALPRSLNVGLASSRGLSLNALVGLTALQDGTPLPLTTWGAGTRRLAALQIAAANQSGSPVMVVDELERGLEPHRQRVLMRALSQSGRQVFLTTHSPTIVSAAEEGTLWFLDASRTIGPIAKRSATHARRDPETFLARLAIVAEGKTEVGFVEHLLDLALDGLRLEYGIWVTDGTGNDNALALLESLGSAGIQVGGFVDFEDRNPERWKRLRETMGDLLWQWEAGCLEENVIPLVPEDRLEEFVRDAGGDLTGLRHRTLQDRLQASDKSWATLVAEAPDIREAVTQAASGFVPDAIVGDDRKTYQSHARTWFKRDGGGLELAQKCSSFGLWEELSDELLPFVNAVRRVAELDPLERMPS